MNFEFDVDPDFVAVCHCLDCKTASGGEAATFLGVPENDFTLLRPHDSLVVEAENRAALGRHCVGDPLDGSVRDRTVGGQARGDGLLCPVAIPTRWLGLPSDRPPPGLLREGFGDLELSHRRELKTLLFQ